MVLEVDIRKAEVTIKVVKEAKKVRKKLKLFPKCIIQSLKIFETNPVTADHVVIRHRIIRHVALMFY